MFNKKEKDMTNKKVWLVIEKNTYGSNSQSFSVIKNHVKLEEAMTYKIYLEKLSDRENQSYFLASDIDTVINDVVKSHNKSVKNGTYHDNQPEIKKEEEANDITF
jgi:type III secretory pathway component EscR